MEPQTNKKDVFKDPIPLRKMGEALRPTETVSRGNSEFKIAKSMASSNYKEGTSGWLFDSNGEVQIKGKIPASASAPGKAGTVAISTTHIYVCTATNTWKRVAIATW